MTVSSKFAAVMAVSAVTWAILGSGAGTATAAGDLYGSIAVAPMKVGEATDYPTQFEADQAALAACGDGVCHIVARIHNECGAVAEVDGRTPLGTSPMYFAGTGRTAAEAEGNALRLAGPNVGTPLLEIVKPAFILDTICTSNAG
ncbi:hypothetical protein NBRGN_104_00120 [Nocardia brasiliensis NBRC 14402]|uniref:DUF4189 domain-containing protein n=1 Tax=Nocardia brasiliensis TaxID=37326 RepID=UPI0002EC9C7C|nr:DUF4189 domain-containing protein [Nocardia brasiliensis]ASF07280.1 DUF4189 domain-containing protein [Nocardia brasiliensis]GAJ86044.1 hypothetical protein NBRGN_104_00120 [Nocardia brasiliensis NBRC 14402]SUB47432.1 Uncharacterised protein [Nocardia brasiliensis]